MDIKGIPNPKDSNVYRKIMNDNRYSTPTGSNVYRKLGNVAHSTPMGSHPFRHCDISINMLSLRDNA